MRSVALALLLTACNGGSSGSMQGQASRGSAGYSTKVNSKAEEKKDSNKPAEAAAAPVQVENEKVTAPAHISGGTLRCDLVLASSFDGASSASIGCRFEDSTNKRLDFATLGSNPQYSISSAAVAGTNTKLRVPAQGSAEYDVFVDVTGAKSVLVNDRAQSLRIRVRYTSLTNVAIDAQSLPSINPITITQSAEHWASVGDNANVFQHSTNRLSGINWYLASNQEQGYAAATLLCENLNRGGLGNWRVPTRSELRFAHAAGMMSENIVLSERAPVSFQNYWISINTIFQLGNEETEVNGPIAAALCVHE